MSTTLLAADASAKVMMAFTLTLTALTTRLMSAGDTLSCISTCFNDAISAVDGLQAGSLVSLLTLLFG